MGAEPPDHLIAPVIHASWQPYWRAFQALKGDRPYVSGMRVSPLPLPYQAKVAYARDWGFLRYPGGLEDFLLVIDAMDTAFLSWHAARAAQDDAQQDGKNGKAQGPVKVTQGGLVNEGMTRD